MASLLMAAEISLAIAYSVGFSLTARQTTSVLALGFLVPVMAVGVVLKAGWGGAGLMLAISIPLSLICIVSLIIFGAVSLGS
jgi:hypothetical protein